MGRATLEALLHRLVPRDRSAWRREVTEEADRRRTIAERRARRSAEPLNPQLLLHELSPRLPTDAMTYSPRSAHDREGQRTVRPEEMIERSPAAAAFDAHLLSDAITACFACAEICSACADACLSQPDVAAMATCIRLDLLCADVCSTLAKALARQGADAIAMMSLLSACATICARCGAECRSHSQDHEHCALCAESCRRCAAACEALLPA